MHAVRHDGGTGLQLRSQGRHLLRRWQASSPQRRRCCCCSPPPPAPAGMALRCRASASPTPQSPPSSLRRLRFHLAPWTPWAAIRMAGMARSGERCCRGAWGKGGAAMVRPGSPAAPVLRRPVCGNPATSRCLLWRGPGQRWWSFRLCVIATALPCNAGVSVFTQILHETLHRGPVGILSLGGGKAAAHSRMSCVSAPRTACSAAAGT